MKRQLPQAGALEDGATGRQSSDNSEPQPCRPRVDCPSAEGSTSRADSRQITGAKTEVLQMAAELYACPPDSLKGSLADVKHALTGLEELAGTSEPEPEAEPEAEPEPSSSQSVSLSSILNELTVSEERELGLCTEFFIDQIELKRQISDYVIAHEPEAQLIMEEFSATTGTTACAFTTFKNTSVKVSAVRLAVFTGKRFLYSSCANSQDGAEVCEPVLRPDGPVQIPACASEFELFLSLVKCQPPEKVTLKAAMRLFSIIEYSMAIPLIDIWIRGLAPMLTQLSEKQMAAMLSAIVGYSVCSSPSGRSPLSKLLYVWEDALRDEADDELESADAGMRFPEAAIFASKLLERVGTGNKAHLDALLQVCREYSAPGWLKVGSVAATMCCAKQVHTDDCCVALRSLLPNCDSGDVAAVLADACVRASHQAQRQHVAALSSAMVQHMADESHKRYLWFTANRIVDESVLSKGASKSADPPLICLPLCEQGCFLLAARMSCQGFTTVNRNWALQLRPFYQSPDSTPTRGVPHVGVYLHNALHRTRRASYALGFMPVHDIEEVVSVLYTIGRMLSGVGFEGLMSEVIQDTPVFMQADVDTFLPLSREGFRIFQEDRSVVEKWEDVAGADWQDSQVKQKEVVAFCIVNNS